MKEIELTMGQKAIVDDCDFIRLNKYKWHALKYPGTYYAARSIRMHGKKKILRMHREILKPIGNSLIDHIDGNGLNNRRENLREASKSENGQNARVRSDNTSGYKGVTKKRKKWSAKISINGKHIYLGVFKLKTDAHNAYVSASKKYHKKYGRIK